MFRRSVATLALFGYIVGQLAMVPHAHGAAFPDEQRQHNARPHFHIGGHSHSHSHAHPPAGDRSPREGISQPGLDHDADAIYVASFTACVGIVSDERDLGAVACFCGMLTASCVPIALHEAAIPLHPPDAADSGGKLFLKLRTLRI